MLLPVRQLPRLLITLCFKQESDVYKMTDDKWIEEEKEWERYREEHKEELAEWEEQ